MSTFVLKMLAAVLMLIDHIGYYFEGMPVILRLIGRGAYPLFLFCMIWGYHYTRSRKMYLLRLYAMSVFMTFFIYAVDTCFVTAEGYGNHNIFISLFWVGLLISTVELFQKDKKKGLLLLAAIFAVQVFYYFIPTLLPFTQNLSGDLLSGIIPNLALNEYGFAFVALGTVMYFVKEKKELLTAVYLLFCIYQFSFEMLYYGSAIQWVMVIALPFMLRYNNQKGPGLKAFFYVYYPAHTFLLFYLANYVFVK